MRLAPLLILSLMFTSSPTVVLGEVIYLEADFDDKPIDEPIGTGGPELGEPVSVESYVIATVRSAPMTTPCLELVDNDTFYVGRVRFEFLGAAEITEGQVVVSATFWIPTQVNQSTFSLAVRERSGAAYRFCDIGLTTDGTAYHGDDNTPQQDLGTFELDGPVALDVVFDMDAGTCDVWIDDVRVLEGEDTGIQGVGVGSVTLFCEHDPDTGDYCFVDDILVSDTFTPAPVEPATWGRIKRAIR